MAAWGRYQASLVPLFSVTGREWCCQPHQGQEVVLLFESSRQARQCSARGGDGIPKHRSACHRGADQTGWLNKPPITIHKGMWRNWKTRQA
ncbi:MAG: hypothetical protein AB2693_28520 [Candidatus Thiodiazotropha sp.]